MESGSTRNVSRFGLAILDIDNLRGHIQSPLQKHDPTKPAKPKPSNKLKASSKMKKPHKNRLQKPGTTATNTSNAVNGGAHDGSGTGTGTSTLGTDRDFGPKIHKKQSSSPHLPRKEIVNDHDDDEEIDSPDTDDDEPEDEHSTSASPLSEVVDHISPSNGLLNDEELEMKYIDDEDLQRTIKVPQSERKEHDLDHHGHPHHHIDDDESSDDDQFGGDAPKSAAERTAAINHQRRKSSLLLQQKDILSLQQREAMKAMEAMNGDHKEDNVPMDGVNGINGMNTMNAMNTMNGSVDSENSPLSSRSDNMNMNTMNTTMGTVISHKDRIQHKKRASRSTMEELSEIQKTGHFLPVGDTNMDPYLLFWNNSKKGESVVKVVQDIILMSINKEINATHFGFGEFAILANVGSESELRRILKRILKTVSSNVATQKLGPVTLCGGLAMYQKGCSISQWVNQCRQACRLAKTNGRGRVAN